MIQSPVNLEKFDAYVEHIFVVLLGGGGLFGYFFKHKKCTF